MLRAVGDELRLRRNTLALSIPRLSELAGVDPDEIAGLERGDPDSGLWQLIRVATTTGMSTGELLDGATGDHAPRPSEGRNGP